MRVGISIGTTFQVEDHRQGPSLVLDQARAAARAGLDTISLGDHHATGPTSYVQNVPMLGRILAEWDSRPAGCLFLVPLWHPVLLAEQIGTLAAMALGPFVVQTGLGGGSTQFRAMGVNLGDRGRLLEEGIVVVQALLRGETVSSASWGFTAARIAPLPPRHGVVDRRRSSSCHRSSRPPGRLLVRQRRPDAGYGCRRFDRLPRGL